MIDVDLILKLHDQTTSSWHECEAKHTDAVLCEVVYAPFYNLVCEQHRYNYLLWHEEDIARSRKVVDSKIAEVKRNIDRYNQQRNDAIERLDDSIIAMIERQNVKLSSNYSLNTETPGSVIDRLSILSLRLYHMLELSTGKDVDGSFRDEILNKVSILREQRRDLSTSLAQLLEALFEGVKKLKIYRQFKMYNDPKMNKHMS